MAFLAAVWEIWTFIFEVLGISASMVLLWRERGYRRKKALHNHHRASPARRDSDRVVWLCILLFIVSATSMASRFI